MLLLSIASMQANASCCRVVIRGSGIILVFAYLFMILYVLVTFICEKDLC